MPLKSSTADAFGVATICVVFLLILLGLLCILYSFYFRSRIHSRRFSYLSYFGGPWVVRIILILFTMWWGFGEIFRLSLLRRGGMALDALSYGWQERVCKMYVVSNLGFAEPCVFLTVAFLLRATLQKMESGSLSQKWNVKTAGYVLLSCVPILVLQICLVLMGEEWNKTSGTSTMPLLPHYFTRTAIASIRVSNSVALCTYPLLSTAVLGIFSIFLTVYIVWVGGQILKLVINKSLQKRVYTLILSVSGLLPLRVLLLGLTVVSMPDHFPFETFSFCAFLALVCCAMAGICVLVYCPVADSLALKDLMELESGRRLMSEEEESVGNSISFRGMEVCGRDEFVELSLFSTSRNASSPHHPGFSPSRFPSHL